MLEVRDRQFASLAKNGADARAGVLQIGRGVALERQHLVPTEHVIALTVGQQVRVLHRAESDNAGDLTARNFGQIGVFLRDHVQGALLRFVQQFSQLDRIAAARLEGFAVVAENFSEAHMDQLGALGGLGLPAGEGEEQLAKVRGLAVVHHIDNLVRRPGLDAVIDGRKIGGGVIEPTVALAYQRRVRRPFTIAIDEKGILLGRQRAVAKHADRAFTLLCDAALEEVGHDVTKPRVVETFAERVIKLRAEPTIDGGELLL